MASLHLAPARVDATLAARPRPDLPELELVVGVPARVVLVDDGKPPWLGPRLGTLFKRRIDGRVHRHMTAEEISWRAALGWAAAQMGEDAENRGLPVEGPFIGTVGPSRRFGCAHIDVEGSNRGATFLWDHRGPGVAFGSRVSFYVWELQHTDLSPLGFTRGAFRVELIPRPLAEYAAPMTPREFGGACGAPPRICFLFECWPAAAPLNRVPSSESEFRVRWSPEVRARGGGQGIFNINI